VKEEMYGFTDLLWSIFNGVLSYLLIRSICRPLCKPDYSDDFPLGVSVKPFFSWADHPSLINDAVENGFVPICFNGQHINADKIDGVGWRSLN
jgi:hypothetical protein